MRDALQHAVLEPMPSRQRERDASGDRPVTRGSERSSFELRLDGAIASIVVAMTSKARARDAMFA